MVVREPEPKIVQLEQDNKELGDLLKELREALREEQTAALDRIEAEYREQLAGLRRDAESKEQKLAEQWAAKHLQLTKFLEQVGCRSRLTEPNGRQSDINHSQIGKIYFDFTYYYVLNLYDMYFIVIVVLFLMG